VPLPHVASDEEDGALSSVKRGKAQDPWVVSRSCATSAALHQKEDSTLQCDGGL
jgi:hypothetical protein